MKEPPKTAEQWRKLYNRERKARIELARKFEELRDAADKMRRLFRDPRLVKLPDL